METTELDRAFEQMEASPDDTRARLQFYERLADTELFLLLASEPSGDSVEPEIFPVDDQQFVLVFDRIERLTHFTSNSSPYAAMSGRMLAKMLVGQGIGIGLNLDVSPSSMLLPATALDWLVDALSDAPLESTGRPVSFHRPEAIPEVLIEALSRKLATAVGLAEHAFLAGVLYDNDVRGHILVVSGAAEGAEPALASAVGEALRFSGLEAGWIDVTFVDPNDSVVTSLEKAAIRFDIPAPEPVTQREAPGSNPDKPPKLR